MIRAPPASERPPGRGEVDDDQPGMGLVGSDEPLVDPEVDRRPADADEPAAVARRELVRFGDFAQAEQLAVEPPRRGFAAGRHQELDVIDPDDLDRGRSRADPADRGHDREAKDEVRPAARASSRSRRRSTESARAASGSRLRTRSSSSNSVEEPDVALDVELVLEHRRAPPRTSRKPARRSWRGGAIDIRDVAGPVVRHSRARRRSRRGRRRTRCPGRNARSSASQLT